MNKLTLKTVGQALKEQKNSTIQVADLPCDLSWGKYWILPYKSAKNGNPIAYKTLADLVKGEQILL
jgi:hypothetical protein